MARTSGEKVGIVVASFFVACIFVGWGLEFLGVTGELSSSGKIVMLVFLGLISVLWMVMLFRSKD